MMKSTLASQFITVPISVRQEEVFSHTVADERLQLFDWQTGIQKELQNYKNNQYYAKLWIGSQKQELQFIFDTGSPWFWAPTVDCLLCHEADKFDTSLSATFVNTSSSLSTVHYGSGSVYGYRSKDKICVESSTDDFACTQNL